MSFNRRRKSVNARSCSLIMLYTILWMKLTVVARFQISLWSIKILQVNFSCLAEYNVRKVFDYLIHITMLLRAVKRRVNPSYIQGLRDMYSRLKVCLMLRSLSVADSSLVYAPKPWYICHCWKKYISRCCFFPYTF